MVARRIPTPSPWTDASGCSHAVDSIISVSVVTLSGQVCQVQGLLSKQNRCSLGRQDQFLSLRQAKCELLQRDRGLLLKLDRNRTDPATSADCQSIMTHTNNSMPTVGVQRNSPKGWLIERLHDRMPLDIASRNSQNSVTQALQTAMGAQVRSLSLRYCLHEF